MRVLLDGAVHVVPGFHVSEDPRFEEWNDPKTWDPHGIHSILHLEVHVLTLVPWF